MHRRLVGVELGRAHAEGAALDPHHRVVSTVILRAYARRPAPPAPDGLRRRDDAHRPAGARQGRFASSSTRFDSSRREPVDVRVGCTGAIPCDSSRASGDASVGGCLDAPCRCPSELTRGPFTIRTGRSDRASAKGGSVARTSIDRSTACGCHALQVFTIEPRCRAYAVRMRPGRGVQPPHRCDAPRTPSAVVGGSGDRRGGVAAARPSPGRAECGASTRDDENGGRHRPRSPRRLARRHLVQLGAELGLRRARRCRATHSCAGERPPATLDELRDAVARHAGRRGHRALVAALELVRPGTDSPAETELRLDLVEFGLPEPVVNLPIFDESGHGGSPSATWRIPTTGCSSSTTASTIARTPASTPAMSIASTTSRMPDGASSASTARTAASVGARRLERVRRGAAGRGLDAGRREMTRIDVREVPANDDSRHLADGCARGAPATAAAERRAAAAGRRRR